MPEHSNLLKGHTLCFPQYQYQIIINNVVIYGYHQDNVYFWQNLSSPIEM